MALTGGSERAEGAAVGAVHGPPAGHEVAFGQQVVVDQVEVRERGVRELEQLESITALFRGLPRYAAPASLGAAVGELVRSGGYAILSE